MHEFRTPEKRQGECVKAMFEEKGQEFFKSLKEFK